VTLRARAVGFFVEPRTAAPAEASRQAFLAPASPARVADRPRPATRLPLRAAVLGAVPEAVPVGALLANALRTAAGARAAALAVWTPGGAAPRGAPASPKAARLAARLTARGLTATARGRLALIALDGHPVAATVTTRRAAGALEVPLVTVLAGPRCEVVESLLEEQDLVVVACAQPDGPLARLAVAACTAPALACTPPAPGPARWLASSGLAGPRSLPAGLRALVTELAAVPAPEPIEAAW
jgi:hypothetical protein